MEDSSQFMQWALSMLQHEQPPPRTPAPAPAVTAFDHDGCHTVSSILALGFSASVDSIMVPGEPPALHEAHQATNSRISGDTNSGSCGGLPQMVENGSPATRRDSARIPASSLPYSPADHMIAERKRREKINQRFVELSTVIPGLKKMDKATILSYATRHVRELQEKLEALQQDASGRGMESAVLVKNGGEDGGAPSSSPATRSRNALPEIEVRISAGNAVMVTIHCRDAKGLLVRLLAEVEGLHLSITHTSVMPFSASTLMINIMAKVEEGFNTTADNIVGRLNAALRPRVSNSAE